MLAEETWRIYKANALPLFLAGLLAEALQAGLALLFGGFAVKNLLGPGMNDFGVATLAHGEMPQLMLAHLPGLGLLYVILSVCVGAFTSSGLLHVAALAQRGRLDGVGAFWSGGARFGGRMLGYMLFNLLPWLVLGVAGFLLVWLPWIGISLLILAGAIFGVSYWYGAYAMVAEDLSAADAFGKLFRILGNRLSDVIWSLLLLVVGGLVLGLVSGILIRLPLIGRILSILLNAAVTPFLLLYVGVRYATNIAPVLNPPGGTGGFHASPPPGR